MILGSIVFVHGLGGGRASTWTKDGVFWPRDLLPNDIADARIITWGYDANIAHFWASSTSNDIDNHAANLVNSVGGLRGPPKATDRPIIFVAHSLGGLVCARVREIFLP